MERKTVKTVVMSISTHKAGDQIPMYIPDVDAFIQATGCDELAIGGDGNSRRLAVNVQFRSTGAGLDIPQTDSLVAATSYYRSAISRKV